MADHKPAPRISWRPDPKNPFGVYAQWVGATGTYDLHWGDGAVERVTPGAARHHVYPAAGAYTVSAGPVGGPIAYRDMIFVRSDDEPQVELAPRDDNPNIINLDFTESDRHLISWYTVDWGDGGDRQEAAGPQGARVPHSYRDGSYALTVRDQQAQRWARREVHVNTPDPDPGLELSHPDPKGEPLRVRAKLVSADHTPPVRLHWGVDGAPRPELAKVGDTAEYVYPADGAYIVLASYADGTGDGSAWDVTVPPPARNIKPASQMVITADPDRERTAWVRWFGSGTDYDLDFGDGTSTRRAWWQPPVRHTWPDWGRYLVRGTNDFGHTAQEWTEFAPLPPEPVLVFDATPLTGWIGLSGSAPAGGEFRLTWPGWDPEDVRLQPGEWASAPCLPGQRTLQAVDTATGALYSDTVTVPDRDWGTDFEMSIKGRTVSVKRTRPDPADPPGRWWQVFWGDEWDGPDRFRHPEALPNGEWTSHTYTAPGTYFVEVHSPAQTGTARVHTRIKQVVVK